MDPILDSTDHRIKQSISRRWIIPAMTAIIIIAAFLRFWNLSISPPWYGDECVEVILARDFSNGRLAYDGRSYLTMVPHFSFSPPLYPEVSGLFMKVASLFFGGGKISDAMDMNGLYGARIYTSLLALLAIAPLYILAKELSGTRVALTTSLFYAVHPVVVEHNRYGFRHNQPLLFNLVFLTALAVAARRAQKVRSHGIDTKGNGGAASGRKPIDPALLLAGLCSGLSLFSSYRSYVTILAAAILIPMVLRSNNGESGGWKKPVVVWTAAMTLALLPGLLMYLPFAARDGTAFFANFASDVRANILTGQQMLDTSTREGGFARILKGLQQTAMTDPLTMAGLIGMGALTVRPGPSRWTALFFFGSLISIVHRQEDIIIFFYPLLLVAPLFSLGAAHLLGITGRWVAVKSAAQGPSVAHPETVRGWACGAMAAFLLVAVSGFFRGSWNKVSGKTPPNMGFVSAASASDTMAVTRYLNHRAGPGDLVVANPCLQWLLVSRRSTLLESIGYETGKFPPYFNLPMPRERFLYDPSLKEAKYIVLGKIDQEFTLKLPGVIHHLQTTINLGGWYVELTLGEYTVVRNPAR